MCKKSLFYFGRTINDGYPEETCLHHVKDHMAENGKLYTVCCLLLSINAFCIFLITLCLWKNPDKADQYAVTCDTERKV